MRLSTYAILGGAFAGAAIFSLVAARFAVGMVEGSSEIGVRGELDMAGLEWAEVEADGLQLHLSGHAPSEAQRFRARTLAGKVVDASRVIDDMTVAASEDLAAPQFSIEMLRNGSKLSLAGLIPLETDREALLERFRQVRGVTEVSDLLQTADYPTPDGWAETLDYALGALRDVPRSKVSLSAGEVSIRAMSDSTEARTRLERTLRRGAPEDVSLTLDISAPRPVITPFTLRFLIDENGARFDACSADTEETRQQILTAARALDLKGGSRCVLGLGVPSSNWGRATAQAITALGEIGGGELTFSDTDITLVAAQGTPQATFDRVVGELENALPDVFSLHAVLPPSEDAQSGPPEFVATLSPEGQMQMRGRINDEMTRTAADSYARAKFGSASTYQGARLDETLPSGWPVRVLTALEALSLLHSGSVVATPDSVTVRGDTGSEDTSAEVAQLLSDKLGEGQSFQIDVTYQKRLDPLLNIPTPEQCLAEVLAIQQTKKINFEPGSATVDADSRGVLDDISAVLRKCQSDDVDLLLEVGGYTDSQGREEMNQQLSQQRAEAVLTELRMRRVLTSGFIAVGHGEDDPIADNGTEEGREANRRIEFTARTDAAAQARPALGRPDEVGVIPTVSGDEVSEADATSENGSGDEAFEGEGGDEGLESGEGSGAEGGTAADEAPDDGSTDATGSDASEDAAAEED